MRKTHRKITAHETIRAHEMLKTYLITMSDGTVAYRDDWSDEKIAQAISPSLPRTSISRLRRELFGDLRRATDLRDPVTRDEFDRMAAQVEELKAEVDRLHRMAARVEDLKAELDRFHQVVWEELDVVP